MALIKLYVHHDAAAPHKPRRMSKVAGSEPCARCGAQPGKEHDPACIVAHLAEEAGESIMTWNGHWTGDGSFIGVVQPRHEMSDEALLERGITALHPLGLGEMPHEQIALVKDHATREPAWPAARHPANGDHMHHVAAKLYDVYRNPAFKPNLY
jgi:hypothetical protein